MYFPLKYCVYLSGESAALKTKDHHTKNLWMEGTVLCWVKCQECEDRRVTPRSQGNTELLVGVTCARRSIIMQRESLTCLFTDHKHSEPSQTVWWGPWMHGWRVMFATRWDRSSGSNNALNSYVSHRGTEHCSLFFWLGNSRCWFCWQKTFCK